MVVIERMSSSKSHSLRADVEGNEIVVRDEGGRRVEVEFRSNRGTSVAFASVRGLGIVGGWISERPQAWRRLAAAINAGNVYDTPRHLPRT